jgi:hypothetical protein
LLALLPVQEFHMNVGGALDAGAGVPSSAEAELRCRVQLQAFKVEVAQLKKTRHENLVLFMGACMRPPKLAIVTELCRGRTLYHELHVRRERFILNRAILIATQITQVAPDSDTTNIPQSYIVINNAASQ